VFQRLGKLSSDNLGATNRLHEEVGVRDRVEALDQLGKVLGGHRGILGVAGVAVSAQQDGVAHQSAVIAFELEATVGAIDEAFVIDVEGVALGVDLNGREVVATDEAADVGVVLDDYLGDGVLLGVKEEGFVVALHRWVWVVGWVEIS